MKQILFLFLLGFSVLTHAEPGPYASIHFGNFDFELVDTPISVNIPTVGASIGYNIFGILGLELRAGAGLGDQKTQIEVNNRAENIEVSMDYYYSALIRPQIKLKHVNLYLLGGYSETQIKFAANNLPEIYNDKDTGATLGGGIGYVNNDRIAFNLEFLQLADTDNISLNSIHFSVEIPL